jgi:two-component system sensor histidine kinase AlgZ
MFRGVATRFSSTGIAQMFSRLFSDYARSTLVVVAGWLLIAVSWSIASHLSHTARGVNQQPWLMDFAELLLSIIPWLLATPLMLWLGDHYSVARPHVARNLAIQVLAALLLIPILETAGLALYHFLLNLDTPLFTGKFGTLLAINALFAGPTYVAVIGIGHAISWFRRYREREHELAQVQLTALRTQLNPHFLFNTINAVTAAGYRDPALSDRILTRLAELLRASLACDQQSIPLSEEVAFLKAYVEIHQMLSREPLSLELEIGPGLWHAGIPPMLLQPLVENAIVHGISQLEEGGVIHLRAERAEGRLRLSIENDTGSEEPRESSAIHRLTRGIGLRNTRDRLRVLYGADHHFSFQRAPGERAVVRVEIPFDALATGAVN